MIGLSDRVKTIELKQEYPDLRTFDNETNDDEILRI